MTANLLQVLCKVDGETYYEKCLCYYGEEYLTDEEIIELNPNDLVYDLNLKACVRVRDSEAHAQAVKRCSNKSNAMAEPLHQWLESRCPEPAAEFTSFGKS